MANICIINVSSIKVHEDDLNKGCGGSETWLIKIAQAFASVGDNNVYICAECNDHQQNEKIRWCSLENMRYLITHNHFDAILVSRIYFPMLSDILKLSDCHNIYIMAHDTYIIDELGKPVYYDNLSDWDKKNIKKIFVLSEDHKKYFNLKWKYPINMLEISANGLDFELLEKYNNNIERDNSILWSIRYERHFNVLAYKLAPIIRKYVPDFKIYTCSYVNDLAEEYKKYDYIINLGKLSKDELYKEMSKHKVYFHPMLFFETFCISILEGIMSGCNIITANKYGAATTLMPYSGFLLDRNIDYNSDKDVLYVALKIVNYIYDYNSEENKALRASMQTYLKNTYSWEKIAIDLLKNMKIIN